MDWNKKIAILKENGFLYVGDRYIHNVTGKEFWVEDIKKLDDMQFEKFIRKNSKKTPTSLGGK